ncbi:RNA 3'-terminal-phosphate cyclase (ATP) [Penicillium ucsense]|uniref:RNA 3'-terminal-phosphate cyclase (ATP) n=1 Tax=Penicillium ucsense TaxID=2839758 RepID=A0A8J8WHI2_9EURO|nr:RNA 3'-terminal-phosphate cyclase (ATP) [Penicillium ucsense]KAF7737387.1 RNA 3'-terminal-phosphate cyclase (ATP) [Penicillium ucsense]
MNSFKNLENAASETSDVAPHISPHIHIDGRTLEGGGQLVRIALGLSALAGRPVTIDFIRGNRRGRTGLRGSHLAAVGILAEIGGSHVTNDFVGARSITFTPPQAEKTSDPATASPTPKGRYQRLNASLVPLDSVSPKSVYNIRTQTPGSICLIYQALYPYMIHVGARTSTKVVKVNIVGGTNGSGCPSYDYISQVIAPNFARLVLPALSVKLHKRGWATGSLSMGEMSFFIRPLPTSESCFPEGLSPASRFPMIDVMSFERGQVTRIDVTALAPRDALPQNERNGSCLTVLDYSSVLAGSADGTNTVPINTHLTEVISHFCQIFLLLVAHTSNRFRIGPLAVKPSCLDSYMRDQIVVFEELARLGNTSDHQHFRGEMTELTEDRRYWTLHTETAQWVCREMLFAE